MERKDDFICIATVAAEFSDLSQYVYVRIIAVLWEIAMLLIQQLLRRR